MDQTNQIDQPRLASRTSRVKETMVAGTALFRCLPPSGEQRKQSTPAQWWSGCVTQAGAAVTEARKDSRPLFSVPRYVDN